MGLFGFLTGKQNKKTSTQGFFKQLSFAQWIIFFILLIIGVQIVSFVLNSLSSDIPVFKSGMILIFISGGITLSFLIQIIFRTQIQGIDIFALLILMALTAGAYIYLPEFFPQIFSIFGDSAIESARALQSSLGLP